MLDNSRENDVRIVKIRQKIKWWRCFLRTTFTTLRTKKHCYPFIFGRIFFKQFSHHFNWELSHNFDFLFKIKIPPLQLDWHCFQSKEPKLAPVQSIFVSFWRFTPHLDENCLTNLNLFSKLKSNYGSSNSDDFSELDCVHTITFSMEGEDGTSMALNPQL